MKHLENHPAGVPLKIKYPEMPLYEFWNNSARKFPGRDSLIYLGARYTYSKIWKQVQSFAKNLQKMGVKKGDNIGIILPNCPQFIISYYAAQLLGATVVTINPLMPKEEIEREINHTDCKILIVLDRLLDKVHEENIRFIIAEAAYYAPPFIRIISRIKYRNIGLPEKSIRFEEMIEGPPIKEL
jgi:acyl-CoA synthetase (AMP-forming)/AMP-acid ligase II